MTRVCVFCGSSPGALPDYREAARALGEALAARGIGLVFGGGSVGLMGVLADAVMGAGGETPESPSCASSSPCTSARR